MAVKLLIVMIFGLIIIACINCYMFYLKGYIAGFNKCKKIDDEILDQYNK